MRLLYVTEQTPNRDPVRGNGSSLIPYEVILALPRNISIDLVTWDDGIPVPLEICRVCLSVTVLPTEPRRPGLRSTVATALSARSLATRECVTPGALEMVQALSRHHDITLIHGSRIASMSKAVGGPSVVQVIDPWSSVLAMEAALTTGWRALFRRAKSWQALRSERRLPPRVHLLTVGREDAETWTSALRRPVAAVPNGFAVPPPFRVDPAARPTVCFLGSLDYGPNIESVRILVKTIAPRVWESVPDAHFIIAGRNPVPAILSTAGPGVEILANFESVTDVLQNAHVAAFPDAHGVGVRNSVTEVLLGGCRVVATAAAARGQDPHALLTICDGIDAFVDAVIAALTMPTDHPDGAHHRGRSWDDVAADYLHELRRAISSAAAVA